VTFPVLLAAALAAVAWPAVSGKAACALAEAAGSGDAARVSALLDGGVDPDCKATACKMALSRWMALKGESYKETAKVLLAAGARLDDHGPVFEHAMKSVSEDIVPLLKPKTSAVRRWIFRLAYGRGDAAMRTSHSLRLIGALLDKGAPVNGTDRRSGDTLLHIAAQFRDLELARLLVSRGADPSAKHPKKGVTPRAMAEAGLKGRNAKSYRALVEVLAEPPKAR
jgi:ankyrin repeat protein